MFNDSTLAGAFDLETPMIVLVIKDVRVNYINLFPNEKKNQTFSFLTFKSFLAFLRI